MRSVLSVITPTYNHEATIGACIESVLAQSFSDWEMIVVDDGSTDGTVEVVSRYDDPRLRLIRQENIGLGRLAETYNRALSACQGDYVAILEGDDYWPAQKLATQVAMFDAANVVLVSGTTEIVDPEGRQIGRTPTALPPSEVADNRPVGSAAMYMMHPEVLTYTFPVSTVVRRSTLLGISGFESTPGLPVIDYPTFLRMAVEGEFRFTPEVCGYWRRHASSATKSRLPEILEGAYRTAIGFIRRHRHQLPATDEELDALELAWEHFLGQLCMLRGRMLAGTGERQLARRAFREVETYRSSAKTRLSARLADGLIQVGGSPEILFRLLGRPHWSTLYRQGDGDAVVAREDMDRPRPLVRWRT